MPVVPSYLTPEGKSHVRVAFMARSIQYGLARGGTVREGKVSCLDFAVRSGIFKAPSLFWDSSMGLRRVCHPAEQHLASICGAHWKGGLWNHPALSVYTATSMLTTEDEQCWMAVILADNFLLPVKGIQFMKQSDTVPAEIMARLEMALASLEQALIAKDPLMPQHLRQSHSLLIQYPETVNLLSDEEVASLIDAAEIHTKTEIVKAAASGKGGSSARAKKVSASDL